MKNRNLIPLFFLLLVSLQMEGQKLLQNGNQWSYWTLNLETEEISITLYEINGDTLLNGVLYKKIYSSSDDMDNVYVLENYFLRQTDDGKTFRLDADSHESLIADIELEQGDSFLTNDSCEFTLHFIREKLLNNDQVVRQSAYTYKSLDPDDSPVGGVNDYTWLENVGNLKYPFYGPEDYCPDTIILNYATTLTCFISDNELLYGSDEACSNFSTSVKAYEKVEFSISPNPFITDFEIISAENNGQIESLSIVDVRGLEYRKLENMKSNTVRIEASDFSSGVYFVNVITAKGEVKAYKLMKY